ncbi:MAG TPA: YjgP/YjgQ family permease [Bacteroidetes bacterium]|nr:YjgP/YjgQ family permease [Bacteroidota bacterium]
MNKIDRFIIKGLLSITLLVLLLLILIFIIVHFSENVDDFTDRGATFNQIWTDYYLPYIPEIIRLVLPVAVFTSCLLLTGQMAQRLEITALKAAGVSLYRLMTPFLLFAIISAGIVSYLDGFVVPLSNKQRIEFERQYLMSKSDRVDTNKIYRQESENTLLSVNYYAPDEEIGYRIQLFRFDETRVIETLDAGRMEYNQELKHWEMYNTTRRVIHSSGYDISSEARIDTVLTILPRDLARTTSDIFQLTYPEVVDYLESLERVGASEIGLPRIQFYGKLFYPFSIIVVTILGVSLASVRRSGGTGFILGAGLAVSFLYLAIMKIIEPFGAAGTLDAMWAALIPHILFLGVAMWTLFKTPK